MKALVGLFSVIGVFGGVAGAIFNHSLWPLALAGYAAGLFVSNGE